MPRRRRLENAPSSRSETYAELRNNLSPAEQIVADQFLRLHDDKPVAQFLHRRPQTIHNLMASVLRKLGVASRVEFVHFCCTRRRSVRLDAASRNASTR